MAADEFKSCGAGIGRALGDRLAALSVEIDAIEHDLKSVRGRLADETEFLRKAGDAAEMIAALSNEFNLGYSVPDASSAARLEEEEKALAGQFEERNKEREERKRDKEILYSKFPEIMMISEKSTAMLAETDGRASGEVLALFNLSYFKTKLSRSLDDNPVIIIDGYNVIGTVPRYDYRVSGCELRVCRDRIIRDVDFLGTQVEGEYVVVFDTVHSSLVEFKHGVKVVYPQNRQSSKQSGDREIVRAVEEDFKDSRTVYVVTNDNLLGESVRDLGASVLKVGEVFKY